MVDREGMYEVTGASRRAGSQVTAEGLELADMFAVTGRMHSAFSAVLGAYSALFRNLRPTELARLEPICAQRGQTVADYANRVARQLTATAARTMPREASGMGPRTDG